MSHMIAGNAIICYFHRDSSGLVAAFRDKKQTSFLLQFLNSLSPADIDCRPNWVEITCNRQVTEYQVMEMNKKLQESIDHLPEHQALRNCEIMLKITFQLCRLLEGVEYIRNRYKKGKVAPTQINNYLLEISQQIQAISPSNIKKDLFIIHPPPKQIIEKNKKRISILMNNNNNKNSPQLSPFGDDNTSLFNIKNIKEIKNEDIMSKKQCKQQFYSISESKLKHLPIPLDEQYPIDLYNNIDDDRSNTVRYDYNTNNDNDIPIYPNDFTYSVTLKDFIDRKFHLNNNIVKKWVNDRAYFIDKLGVNIDEKKENDEKDENEDDNDMNIRYRKFAIIDVRCHDFVGGNIPYCFNVSYEIFVDVINDLLIEFESESDIIFHCMYSQHRAPRTAYLYWVERRKWENIYRDKLYKQRIWILDGGFKQWLTDNLFNSHLVCNYDANYWEDEYFPLTGTQFFYRNDWKPHQTK